MFDGDYATHTHTHTRTHTHICVCVYNIYIYIFMYVCSLPLYSLIFFMFSVLYVSNLANFGEERAGSHDAKY